MLFFIFIQNLREHSVSEQWRADQMPLSAASDLGLHCLPMYHKKDARLMWVNILKRETTILTINAKDSVFVWLTFLFELEIYHHNLIFD